MSVNPSNSTPFLIRKAIKSDAPEIMAMIRELAVFEHIEAELQTTVDALKEALFGEAPLASALVAEAEGHIAGYAVYFMTFSTFVGRPGVFLEDLYVRPSFRKQGIGRSLIESVAQVGVERGCGRYEWIALRWNETALRFYQHLGARVLDEWVMLRMGEAGMKHLAGKPSELPTP